ncbi:MAG TPA: protease pro-enzyme activation domain-containing protein [Actinocrinis sp.]
MFSINRRTTRAAARAGFVGASAAALVACGIWVGATGASAQTTANTPVKVGAAPVVPSAATHAAAPSGSTPLTVDVNLQPRNEAAIGNLVTAISTPGSPEFHHYLSKGQYTSLFGPTSATVDAVEAGLEAKGLKVSSVSSDNLTIHVSTTFAGAQAAFGTGFAGYQLGSRHVYANTSAPQLPASIASDVAGVIGLDDLAEETTDAKPIHSTGTGAQKSTASPNYQAPGICSDSEINLYPYQGGLTLENGVDFYEPSTLDSIYGLTPELGAGDDGGGVSVGVFELESYDPTGVADYEKCFGLSNPVKAVKVDGGPTAAPNLANNVGVESAIDIENIAALAQGSTIIDYEGPDAVNATDANVEDVYSAMVTQDVVKVISTSWGQCELDPSSPSLAAAENTIFQEAALQGQTVVAASGDNGSETCAGDTNLTAAQQAGLVVDDPASQPYVLGVGGTSMTGTAAPQISVWNNSFEYTGGGATGGGVSETWSAVNGGPQGGVEGSGYSNLCNAPTGSVCRQVPDVSALADPNDGVLITVYYDNPNDPTAGPGEYSFLYGGTSLAAPIWAAVLAIADASKDCAGNGSVGFVNPTLYEDAAAGDTGILNDVISQNTGISGSVNDNALNGSGYAGSEYPVTNGYDLTTGLGGPVGTGVTKSACGSVAPPTASYYVPVTPTRILDTQTGTGAPQAPVAGGGVVTLQVGGDTVGSSTIPTSGVTAVVLNLTATGSTTTGYITAYPTGTPTPGTSNLHFPATATVSNLVIVPVSAAGKLSLYNGAAGTTNLYGDVEGYFTSSSSAAGVDTYDAITPVRFMDTRNGTGVREGSVPADGSVTLPVAGKNGVPANATAVAINTIAITGTSGSITVYPSATVEPSVPNLYYGSYTIANVTIVPLDSSGDLTFANNSSSAVQMVADVSGYYVAGTGGEVFHASAPVRLMYTANGIGVGSTTPLAAGATMGFNLGDAGSTLASSSAVVGTLAAISPQDSGFVTAYPASIPRPTPSSLDFPAGQSSSNLAILPNTDGSIEFYNSSAGSIQLLLDLNGYFSTH